MRAAGREPVDRTQIGYREANRRRHHHRHRFCFGHCSRHPPRPYRLTDSHHLTDSPGLTDSHHLTDPFGLTDSFGLTGSYGTRYCRGQGPDGLVRFATERRTERLETAVVTQSGRSGAEVFLLAGLLDG